MVASASDNEKVDIKRLDARAKAGEDSFIFGSPFFPSESRAAFQELIAELELELSPPKGPLAAAIVRRIAALVWRFDHLAIFRTAREAAREYAPFVRGRTLQEAQVVHGTLHFNILVETVEKAPARQSSNSQSHDANTVAKSANDFEPYMEPADLAKIERVVGKEGSTSSNNIMGNITRISRALRRIKNKWLPLRTFLAKLRWRPYVKRRMMEKSSS